jgi:hypothetical protein
MTLPNVVNDPDSAALFGDVRSPPSTEPGYSRRTTRCRSADLHPGSPPTPAAPAPEIRRSARGRRSGSASRRRRRTRCRVGPFCDASARAGAKCLPGLCRVPSARHRHVLAEHAKARRRSGGHHEHVPWPAAFDRGVAETTAWSPDLVPRLPGHSSRASSASTAKRLPERVTRGELSLDVNGLPETLERLSVV